MSYATTTIAHRPPAETQPTRFDELNAYAAARGWHLALALYPQSCPSCPAALLRAAPGVPMLQPGEPCYYCPTCERVYAGRDRPPVLVLELHVEPGRLLWFRVDPLVSLNAAAGGMLGVLRTGRP